MQVKVIDLTIGDVFWFNRTLAVVKEVKTDRVAVSKITAPSNCSANMSASFSISQYEDLKNRVTLASQAEIDEYIKSFNEDSRISRQRFMAGIGR